MARGRELESLDGRGTIEISGHRAMRPKSPGGHTPAAGGAASWVGAGVRDTGRLGGCRVAWDDETRLRLEEPLTGDRSLGRLPRGHGTYQGLDLERLHRAMSTRARS